MSSGGTLLCKEPENCEREGAQRPRDPHVGWGWGGGGEGTEMGQGWRVGAHAPAPAPPSARPPWEVRPASTVSVPLLREGLALNPVPRLIPLGDGSSRSSELKRRCEELEAQLKLKEDENGELLRELEQKDAMILVLESTVRERERKYLEELKLKSHKLNMLSSELEQRAGTIAYLTSQLHAAKRKLMSSGGTSDGSPSGSPVLASYKPAPPKDKLPETPRRRMKKSLSAPLHPEFEEVYRFGAESRKLLLREPVDAMPDPTPFLLARESAEVHLVKERPLVIPPIASDRGSSEPHSPAREKQHKAHVGVAHRIHHAAPPQAPPEVETLAVDQVNGGKAARKHSGTDRTV